MVLNNNFPKSSTAIAEKLESDGFVCLEEVISEGWLERARVGVEAYVESEGKKFFSIVNPADERESPFFDIVHHPEMQRLFRELSRVACPNLAMELPESYNVLRVNAGHRGTEGALNFHYDASIITAVLPIFIPNGVLGKCGELITFANRRPFRSFLALNLIEKATVQNAAYRRSAKRQLEASHGEHVQVLNPGNLYLFWGYRTYHGNLPCNPPALRATFLIHYGNPHGNSPLLRAIRGGRRLVESMRRKLS